MLSRKISDFFRHANMEEPLALRWARMLGGILYGFIAGLAYGLTMGSIDAILFRDLPMKIEWGTAILVGVLLGFSLALVGALTDWFSEWYVGVGVGALATGVIGLGVQLSAVGIGAFGVLMLVLMVLPVAVLSLPIALILRWLSGKHAVLHLERRLWKKMAGMFLLVCCALALGMFSGFFEHKGASEERSLRVVNTALRTALSDPEQAQTLHLDLPGLKEHLGSPYTLLSAASKVSTVGYDVQVIFQDGFAITCETVAYSDTPYIRACSPETDATIEK